MRPGSAPPPPPLVHGRPEAAVVHWSPLHVAAPASDGGVARGGLWRAVVAVIASALLYRWAHPLAAAVALGMGLLTGGLAVMSPRRGYVALEHATKRLTGAVTTGLTWLVVGVAWIAVLTPLGLWLRTRQDPLALARGPGFVSYWKPRQLERRPQNRPF